MSLLFTVFVLVFITELIAWVGQSVLLDLVRVFSYLTTSRHLDQYWQVYAVHQRIFNSTAVARQRQLKSEILSTRAELLKTSAQDQFAKWAKLRRSIDKGLAELEKLSCVVPLFIYDLSLFYY